MSFGVNVDADDNDDKENQQTTGARNMSYHKPFTHTN